MPSMNLQFHLMVNIVAGWINRHQQVLLDYLTEERSILIEQLGGKPKCFTNTQRIGLARKAKNLGRRTLFGISPLNITIIDIKSGGLKESFLKLETSWISICQLFANLPASVCIYLYPGNLLTC